MQVYLLEHWQTIKHSLCALSSVMPSKVQSMYRAHGNRAARNGHAESLPDLLHAYDSVFVRASMKRKSVFCIYIFIVCNIHITYMLYSYMYTLYVNGVCVEENFLWQSRHWAKFVPTFTSVVCVCVCVCKSCYWTYTYDVCESVLRPSP